MKKSMLSTIALLSFAGFASLSQAQDAGVPPPPPPPVQEQANPQGPGAPTDVPPAPATAADPVSPAMPADPSYNAGPYKGALTPPPPEAMDKTYPICTKKMQDSCRNPGGK